MAAAPVTKGTGADRYLRSDALGKWLITFGLVLVAVGLLWPVFAKLGLGHLPGDIRIERKGFTFYFPLTSGLIVSAVATLILWILRR